MSSVPVVASLDYYTTHTHTHPIKYRERDQNSRRNKKFNYIPPKNKIIQSGVFNFAILIGLIIYLCSTIAGTYTRTHIHTDDHRPGTSDSRPAEKMELVCCGVYLCQFPSMLNCVWLTGLVVWLHTYKHTNANKYRTPGHYALWPDNIPIISLDGI